MIVVSEAMGNYHKSLEEGLDVAYKLATKARKKQLDPEDIVDIRVANDVADRVEKLLAAVDEKILDKGLPDRIRELSKKYGNGDWRVALTIAAETSFKKYGDYGSLEKDLEMGVRVGLAYITMAVTAAPIEGFIQLKLKERTDGQKYMSIYFAGPIRAAGATAEVVTVLIADYLRVKHGIKEYDITPDEIERYKVELVEYHDRVARLQYMPSPEEIAFLTKNIAVEINGDASSDKEVPNYKNLPRVESNRIRGGMCLVLGEGVAQKAKKVVKKLDKWGEEFGLSHWNFLKEYLILQSKINAKGEESEDETSKILPVFKYLAEAVAGRPIFGYPMAKGGFRLRYGRTRLTGLGAAASHPMTMFVNNSFIATGCQLRVERPGKACAITTCDTIEPPIVLLDDGEVLKIDTKEKFDKYKYKIKTILFNGDLLFNYGDFLENNHIITPSPYVKEWWIQELKKAVEEKGDTKLKEIVENPEELFNNYFYYLISDKQAIELSKFYDIPLYPDYLLFWCDLEKEQLLEFLKFIKLSTTKFDKSLENNDRIKEYLEKIKVPHRIVDGKIELDENFVAPFYNSLGKVYEKDIITEKDNTTDIINEFSEVKLGNKSPVYVGARMGRPEKAKLRKMKGKPQALFPVSEQGGRLRSMQEAYKKGYIEADFPLFWCDHCGKYIESRICKCGKNADSRYYCWRCKKHSDNPICDCGMKNRMFSKRKIEIRKIFDDAINNLNITKPPLVKGVRGLGNKTRAPEAMEKGILRAVNDLYVNKDGTMRYDAIEVPMTHFIPKEIGTSIEKLKEIGYTTDIHGKPLEEEHQVLELKAQDLVLPGCNAFADSNSAQEILRMMKFVDDLLEKFYGLPKFYNISKLDDVVGHLVIGIAPHTSAGTLGRIIGFSKSQGYFAHPYFHSACRRNCDGDELSFILLLDGLLNFSRQYLPDVRGGRVMDAPLVITSFIDPNEIDSEAHNVDVTFQYPLSFYERSQEWLKPHEFKVDIVGNHLGKPTQLEGMGYTHPVADMNSGVLVSAYKELDDMVLKITEEMNLAEKLAAVPTEAVATAIIEKHFMRDLRGNLRQFTTQTFRCVKCNEIYRRIPLMGKCLLCGGKLLLTVSEGSVIKYLPHCLNLSEKYNLDIYIKEQLEIIKARIEFMFGKAPTKQILLNKFLQ